MPILILMAQLWIEKMKILWFTAAAACICAIEINIEKGFNTRGRGGQRDRYKHQACTSARSERLRDILGERVACALFGRDLVVCVRDQIRENLRQTVLGWGRVIF